MIMAVPLLPPLIFPAPEFSAFRSLRRFVAPREKAASPRTLRRKISLQNLVLQNSLPQNKKPTRLRVGWNFSFVAVTTNSPLAPYLGGTQNRNQYE
jgi:hypothetical protein